MELYKCSDTYLCIVLIVHLYKGQPLRTPSSVAQWVTNLVHSR